MGSTVVQAYNGGLRVEWDQGAGDRGVKAFWQSCAKFLLKYLVFVKYFYHIHMLLQKGMHCHIGHCIAYDDWGDYKHYIGAHQHIGG